MNAIPLILATVTLAAAGQLLLKTGMASVGALGADALREPIALAWRVARVPQVVFGFLLYGFSAVGWIVVLADTPLSFAYPFLGLSYVVVTAAAVVILKERFAGRQWAGLALIVVGVVVVAFTGRS